MSLSLEAGDLIIPRDRRDYLWGHKSYFVVAIDLSAGKARIAELYEGSVVSVLNWRITMWMFSEKEWCKA